MKKILVIGSLSIDFVVTTKKIPNKGETIIGESFKTFFGGKGANQAVAASRSGLDVSFMGTVGEDFYGMELIKNMQKNKINTQMITTQKKGDSGTAHIQIENGDNRIVVIPGTNQNVTIDLVKQYLSSFDEMDLIIVQNEIPIQTTKFILKYCYENKIKTLYNPAPAIKIDRLYFDYVTYFTPNENEISQLFPDCSQEKVLRMFPNKLIITLGDKGAIFFDGIKEKTVPAEVVKDIVDTTGAGDTFNGYFAWGIVNGLSIENAIKLGNRASAISIKNEGAQDGIPYKNDLEVFN